MLHYMYNRYMKLSNDTEALKACTYIPSLAAAVDYILALHTYNSGLTSTVLYIMHERRNKANKYTHPTQNLYITQCSTDLHTPVGRSVAAAAPNHER